MTASNGAVYLDKMRFSEKKSGFVWTKFITFTEVCEYYRNLCFFNFKHLQYGTTETTISIGTLSPAYPG